MYYTTLTKIRECEPCREGWEKLLKSLGKTKADDEPLSLKHILESNGLDDALWALQAIDYQNTVCIFKVRCARNIQHLMTDQRSVDALDVAEMHAIGEATDEELAAVREAAWEAVAAVDAVSWAAWTAIEVVSGSVSGAAVSAVTAILEASREADGKANETAEAAALAAWTADAVAVVLEAAQEDQKQDFIAIFCQD